MKENVSAFVKLLANYRFNKKQIEKLKENYDVIFNQLKGVISPSFEQQTHSSNQFEKEMKKHDLREKLDKIEDDINFYKSINDYIDSILRKLEEKTRIATYNIYCNKMSYESQAKKLYISKAGLFQKIEKEIDKALNE